MRLPTALGLSALLLLGAPAPALATTDSPRISLRIAVDSGDGVWQRSTLKCDPVGGTHPRPARTCAALLRAGRGVFAPVPADVMCTQQYGGPERARVVGTWRGRAVNASFERTDGCEIARWDRAAMLFGNLR